MTTFIIIVATLIVAYIVLVILSKMKDKSIREEYISWSDKFKPKYKVRSQKAIETTLAGINHDNREALIIKLINKKKLSARDRLLLVPDPENQFDKTAIRVCTTEGYMLGWLPNREWNDKIYEDLISGKKWDATIKRILSPSSEYNNYNLLIELWEYSEA